MLLAEKTMQKQEINTENKKTNTDVVERINKNEYRIFVEIFICMDIFV